MTAQLKIEVDDFLLTVDKELKYIEYLKWHTIKSKLKLRSAAKNANSLTSKIIKKGCQIYALAAAARFEDEEAVRIILGKCKEALDLFELSYHQYMAEFDYDLYLKTLNEEDGLDESELTDKQKDEKEERTAALFSKEVEFQTSLSSNWTLLKTQLQTILDKIAGNTVLGFRTHSDVPIPLPMKNKIFILRPDIEKAYLEKLNSNAKTTN